MMNISSIFDKQAHSFDTTYRKTKIYTLPFSEEDVLQLQKTFVSCGVHVIQTTNHNEGRKIIKTILQSLNYYHTIGCITQINELPSFACNILHDAEFLKKSTNNLIIDLENFFAVQANFDFIWVEFNDAMQKKYALQDIKNIFEMYHAQERMPVIIMMYE